MSEHPESAPKGENEERESRTLNLVRLAQGGDADAVEELFAAHYERLKRVVRSQLGAGLRANIDDTQDILQSAFCGALKSLPKYEPEGEDAWVRWMGTIIANKIASRVRYHRAEKRGGGAHPVGGTEGLGLLGNSRSSEETPDALAAAQENSELIYLALERLEASQRQLLINTHISKRPLAEIAQGLGCSEDSARHRVKRAEKALGAVLRKMRQE